MTSKDRQESRQRLKEARKDLEEAQVNGDLGQISYSAAKLGLALIDAEKFKDGDKQFREAEKIARNLKDFSLEVSCLSLKALAYQISGQFPTAFTTAQKIEEMAIEKDDRALQSDALATQGQILIESGDELGSLEKFNSALSIVEDLKDTYRVMKLKGALGHYSLTIAAYQQAETYFKEATTIARKLGDREAEFGYQGNLGILYNLKGDYDQAIEVFTEILVYMQEVGNKELELQIIHRIIGIYGKMGNQEQVISVANKGYELGKEAGIEIPISIYEILIETYYHSGQIELAYELTREAVRAAKAQRQLQSEVNLILSMAESLMLENRFEDAEEAYESARQGARKLKHHDQEAYMIGRIGVALAEQGKFEEAAHNHRIAVKVAQEMELKSLEAEQLTMLALAQIDMGKPEEALTYADQALQIYQAGGADEEVAKLEQLISQVQSQIGS